MWLTIYLRALPEALPSSIAEVDCSKSFPHRCVGRGLALDSKAFFGWLPSQHDSHVGTSTIQFTSLGLAVLDNIWIGSSEYAKEVLGGSGACGAGSPLFVHVYLHFKRTFVNADSVQI